MSSSHQENICRCILLLENATIRMQYLVGLDDSTNVAQGAPLYLGPQHLWDNLLRGHKFASNFAGLRRGFHSHLEDDVRHAPGSEPPHPGLLLAPQPDVDVDAHGLGYVLSQRLAYRPPPGVNAAEQFVKDDAARNGVVLAVRLGLGTRKLVK